jgi:putative ABC transport system permease protein
MSPRWRKMLGDARATRGRMLMIVIALGASIAALATMLTAYSVLTREVPRNYLSTQPASAQLEMADPVDEELLAKLRARPEIAMAEAAGVVIGRVETGNGDWIPLRVFVIPDFSTLAINTLHPEQGAWPPPAGTMLIERSALALSATSIGQALRVEFSSAGLQPVVISGTVHDPGLAPAWQEQTVYAYMNPETLRALGEPVSLNLLKLLVASGSNDMPAIERTTRSLAQWLNEAGHPVHELRIPPPGKHPHQGQMSSVLKMLLSFSVLAVLLGAILTATVIGGLLAQQVRQNAIMKALGASSRQITVLYLVLVGALGMTAVAIGAPLGILAGREFIAIVAELLNLRIESQSLPPSLFASLLLLGVGAPVMAAWIPIRAAAARTVRDAIDDHGVANPASGSGQLPRWMIRFRTASPALTLAFRNTFRRRTRLVLTMALLAGAGAMFITALNLRAAWQETVSIAAGDRHFDLELRLQGPQSSADILAAQAGIADVRVIESWGRVSVSRASADGLDVVNTYPDGGHGGASLRSAPVDTTLIAHQMIAGRWLRAEDADAVVLNGSGGDLLAPGAKPGDWINLEVEDRVLRLQIVGIMREPLTPAAAYVTPQTFDRASAWNGRSNAIRMALADPAQTATAVADIVRALEQAGIGVETVITERRFLTAERGHIGILVYALGFIAVLMGLVGLLGLTSALVTSVTERIREIGVLRTLGARSSTLMAMVISEGVLVCLLSVATALPISVLVSARVGSVIGAFSRQSLSPDMSATGILVWLAVIVPASIAASWFPARRAAAWTIQKTLSSL